MLRIRQNFVFMADNLSRSSRVSSRYNTRNTNWAWRLAKHCVFAQDGRVCVRRNQTNALNSPRRMAPVAIPRQCPVSPNDYDDDDKKKNKKNNSKNNNTNDDNNDHGSRIIRLYWVLAYDDNNNIVIIIIITYMRVQ